MDKFKSRHVIIRADRAVAMRTTLFWSSSLTILALGLITLSACGGGGGGGTGSSRAVLSVTQPTAAVRDTNRLPLSFGPAYSAEYHRQSGLDDFRGGIDNTGVIG